MQYTVRMLIRNNHYASFLATGAGLGVHRTLFKSFSFSFAFAPFPSHAEALPIASARRDPATPEVVLSKRRLAAGVNAPIASTFLGVELGGGMDPRSPTPGVRETNARTPLPPLMRAAFVRRLFEALFESFMPMTSLEDGRLIRNGVLGVGMSSSSDLEIIRGVALRVPQVISSLTAAGPSCSGEGDGIVGNKE